MPKEEGAVVSMGCTEGANIVVTELGKVFTWGLDIFSLGVAPSTSGHREYFPYAKPQDDLNDLSPIVGGNRSLHHSLNSVKPPLPNPGVKSKRDLAKTFENTPTADPPESIPLRLVGDMRVPRTVSQPQLLPQHLLTAVPCDTIKNQRYYYNILKSN